MVFFTFTNNILMEGSAYIATDVVMFNSSRIVYNIACAADYNSLRTVLRHCRHCQIEGNVLQIICEAFFDKTSRPNVS